MAISADAAAADADRDPFAMDGSVAPELNPQPNFRELKSGKNTMKMKIVSVIALLLTTTAHAYTPATDEEKGIRFGAAISMEMRCEMFKHAPFWRAIRVMKWLEGAMIPSHFDVIKNALERAMATGSYYDVVKKGWIEFPDSKLNATGCENIKNAIRMELQLLAASGKK